MNVQKNVFLKDEGDAWFERNRVALSTKAGHDPVLKLIADLKLAPKHILEIGCADGWRLRALEASLGATCSGVEPSAVAVAEGQKAAPHMQLKVGTAEALDFADGAFDMVIYGFCLYLCDRKDLFRIAAEGDRVLADGGVMVVYDFCTETPYLNPYSHQPGCFSYKMDYGAMFAWNPAYKVEHHILAYNDGKDYRVGITVLRKDTATAYGPNPFS